MNDRNSLLQLGAIVCGHIAEEGQPILCALRAEEQDPADSGWQFLCYSGKDELIEEAQVWSLGDVIKKEPSLGAFIDAPTGTRLVRPDNSSPWSVHE